MFFSIVYSWDYTTIGTIFSKIVSWPPQKNPIPITSHFPFSPSPQSLATTVLLSVFMDLPALDISYKWCHVICRVFPDQLLPLSIYFRIYLCCSIYEYLAPCYDWIIFHCMGTLLFVYPSSVDGHLGCFEFFSITNNVAMNIHVLMWICVFSSIVCIPWSRMSGLYGAFVFNIFQSGCTILHS